MDSNMYVDLPFQSMTLKRKVFLEKRLCGKTYPALMDIEVTYYSAGIYNNICIHCGTTKNLVPKVVENYPRCRAIECNKKGEVVRRKRKTVVEMQKKEVEYYTTPC